VTVPEKLGGTEKRKTTSLSFLGYFLLGIIDFLF